MDVSFRGGVFRGRCHILTVKMFDLSGFLGSLTIFMVSICSRYGKINPLL